MTKSLFLEKNHLKIDSYTLDELPKVAKALVTYAGTSRIWRFDGQMGVGKTSLIKQLCKELKVVDEVSSPTFSLVNEYRTEDQVPVYHFDFYRLEKPEEALDIGLYDYLDSGCYCFIEWAEKIDPLLDGLLTRISIGIDSTTHARTMELENYEV